MTSSRGMYIRNTADTHLNKEYICNADIGMLGDICKKVMRHENV